VTNADTNRPTAMRAMVVTQTLCDGIARTDRSTRNSRLLCRCLFAEGSGRHWPATSLKQPGRPLLVNPSGLF